MFPRLVPYIRRYYSATLNHQADPLTGLAAQTCPSNPTVHPHSAAPKSFVFQRLAQLSEVDEELYCNINMFNAKIKVIHHMESRICEKH